MRLIRSNIFETNSSSTHSITLCTADDIIKWKSGELFYIRDDEEFIKKEDLHDYYAKLVLLEDCEYLEGNKYKYNNKEYSNTKDLVSDNISSVTDDMIENWKEDCFDSYVAPLSYSEYFSSVQEEYETYETSHRTPSGVEVVAFGYYGYN